MFALIKPVDPNDPKVADTIAEWAKLDGTVAIRIMMNDEVSKDPADPGVNRVLSEAAKHDFPVNLLCWERLEQVGELAKRNPDTQIVIDHIGLQQPMAPPAPTQPWAALPKLLALAPHKNVAVKISGGCTLSHEKFPYKDIRAPLGRIFDAFGLDPGLDRGQDRGRQHPAPVRDDAPQFCTINHNSHFKRQFV